MKKNWNFGGNIIIYGFGFFLCGLINLTLIPLYSYLIPVSEYGVLTLGYIVSAFAGVLFNLGIPSALYRYWILALSIEEKKSLLASAIFPIILWGIAGSLIILPIKWYAGIDFMSDRVGNSLFAAAIAAAFLESITGCIYLILRAERRAALFTILRVTEVLLNVGLNFLFLGYFKKGFLYVFYSQIISSVTIMIILLLSIKDYLSFSIKPHTLRELISFGFPFIPAILISYALEWIDRTLLFSLCSQRDVGIFQMGVKLVAPILYGVNAFETAWHPYFLWVYKQENGRNSISRVFVLLFPLLCIISATLSLWVGPILTSGILGFGPILNKMYWDAILIVPILSVCMVMMWIHCYFYCGIYISEKSFWLPLPMLVALIVAAGGNYLLTPFFSYSGAAVAKCAGWTAAAILQAIISQKFYKLSIPWLKVFLIICITLAVSIAPLWVLGLNSFLSRVILVLAISIFSFFFFGKEYIKFVSKSDYS